MFYKRKYFQSILKTEIQDIDKTNRILYKEQSMNAIETIILLSLVLSILVALIISMLFSYHKFPYQYIPKLLLSVQFGFRFVLFIGLFISIFASYGLNLITTKNEENIKNISIILCCLIVLPFINNTTFIKINDIAYDYNQGMGCQKEYLTKYKITINEIFAKLAKETQVYTTNWIYNIDGLAFSTKINYVFAENATYKIIFEGETVNGYAIEEEKTLDVKGLEGNNWEDFNIYNIP